MSWTSEFEPPPPRPNVEPDGQNALEADADEPVLIPAPAEPEASGSTPADEADLDGSEPAVDEAGYDDFWAETAVASEVPDDGPLDPSIFDGLFADLTPASELEDTDADTGTDTDTGTGTGTGTDTDADTDTDTDADTDIDAPDEPLEAVDLDQLADSEPDIQQGDDSGNDSVEVPELSETEPSEPVDTLPEPPVEPTRDPEVAATPEDSPAPEHTETGFDPEETLFELPVEAGSEQVAAASTNGNGVDPASTISISNPEELQQLKPEHPLALPQVPVSEPAHTAVPSVPAAVAAGTGPVDSRALAQATQPGRWRSFAVAIAIGAVLGIGGAVLLSQLVGRSDSNDSTATAVTQTENQSEISNGVDTEADSTSDTDGGQPTVQPTIGMETLGTNGRFELNSLRFEPGSLALTETGQAMLNQAATVAAQRPGSALSVVVRTYSEPTAAGNLELSKSQAQAIADGLIGLGVEPEAIDAVGIGAPPLSTAQPVQNFVVVGAGLQSTALKSAIRDFSPFAIGIDPLSNQLRAESVAQLDLLGQAMTADPDTSISLAGYAYERSDAALNQAQAAVAAETAASYLVASHQVDPNRIALLTPGEATYIVATGTGNHISIRWGDIGQEPTIITEADQNAISFAAGSVNLGPEATEALDRLVAASAGSNASWVIDVHTGSESGPAANEQLGERQAATIVDYLAQAGLGSDRVRVYSGGNLRQFDETGTESRVVITQVP